MTMRLKSLSWKGTFVLLLFAIALSAWTWSGVLFTDKTLTFEEHALYLADLLQRNLLSYFPVYVLVAIVDGLPLQGARRRAALFAALFFGVALAVQMRCAVSPNMMFYVYGEKQISFCDTFPTWRTYFDFPSTFITPFTVAGMVMIFIFARRRNLELAAALNAVRSAQIEQRRQRIESEIEAMQARVDPDWLRATLQAVRKLYEERIEDGEKAMDKLIGDLRQAARAPT